MNLTHIIKLTRPHQYVKNLFIFLPIFFAHKITDTALLTNTIVAFFAFSLTASAIYIINDYFDIEYDRQHPKKKLRPLASGAVSVKQAFLLVIILLATSIIAMTTISSKALIILGAYAFMNLAYSMYLKHIAIVDISIIAVGFVLRLNIGSVVSDTQLSIWIVVMTFLLALFLALAKRRDDIVIFESTGKKMRKVLDGYNKQFLDSAMIIMGSVVIVAYILYTTSSENINKLQSENLYLTSLFVILGILRYLQITFVENNSGSPTRVVLRDRFIQVTIACWVLSYMWIIYL